MQLLQPNAPTASLTPQSGAPNASFETPPAQGGGFDVPSFISNARAQGIPDEQIYNHLQTNGLIPAPQEQKSVGGFIGNVFQSTGNLIGGAVSGIANVFNPNMQKNTIANIVKPLAGVAESALGINGGTAPQDKAQAQAVGDYFKNRYGGGQQILDSLYKDPAGVLADLSTVLDAGGSLLSKAGEVNDIATASRIGDMASKAGEIVNPINLATKAAGGVASLSGMALGKGLEVGQKLAKFGIGQETGFNPETITTIINQPDEFSKTAMANYSREALGGEIKSNIDTLRSNVSNTGKEYNAIRNTPGTVDFATLSPEATTKLSTDLGLPTLDTTKPIIPQILSKYGITIDAKGQLIHDINSIPMSPGDINAIQGFVDKYALDANGQFRPNYTPNTILNSRQALDGLIPYDSPTRTVSDKLVSDLRASYDAVAKEQVPGLKAADTKFAPIRSQLKQAIKDFLNPDGTLKDGAASKIMSGGKAGKESLLARIEKLSPGITEKIKVQAALEDIQHAAGVKVGTYAKAGTMVFAGTTLNPAAIALVIASSPGIATNILRGYGKLLGVSDSALSSILKSNGFKNISQITKTAGSAIKSVALPAAQVGRIRNVAKPK